MIVNDFTEDDECEYSSIFYANLNSYYAALRLAKTLVDDRKSAKRITKLLKQQDTYEHILTDVSLSYINCLKE